MNKRSAQSGAALVEAAFVLPVLLFLTFGMIQLTFLVQQTITIENAAMVGARVAVVTGEEDSECTPNSGTDTALSSCDLVTDVTDAVKASLDISFNYQADFDDGYVTTSVERVTVGSQTGYKVNIVYQVPLLINVFGNGLRQQIERATR